jgi:hypothetical protein
MQVSDPRRDDDLALPARESIKAVSHVRSTILMASQARLREEGLYDRYVAHLPPTYKSELVELGAPCWLPVAVGVAHYAACDALGLAERDVVAIGQQIAMNNDGTFLGIASNIARGSGVTPWALVRQANRIWGRGFMGGALGSTRLGPKELRLDVVSWPCATVPYCRWAFRGLVLGLVKLVSREAYVRELRLSSLTGSQDIALQVSWV